MLTRWCIKYPVGVRSFVKGWWIFFECGVIKGGEVSASSLTWRLSAAGSLRVLCFIFRPNSYRVIMWNVHPVESSWIQTEMTAVWRHLFLTVNTQALIKIWHRKRLFQQQVDSVHRLTLNSFWVSSVIFVARSEKRQDVPNGNLMFFRRSSGR